MQTINIRIVCEQHNYHNIPYISIVNIHVAIVIIMEVVNFILLLHVYTKTIIILSI